MGVGDQIRFWRNSRGLTQVKLAEMAQISRSYLAGVECGNYNPSLDTLTGIAAALHLDPSDLLQDETVLETVIRHKKEEAAAESSDLSELDQKVNDLAGRLTDQEKQMMIAQMEALIKMRK